jgi:hypothetical protein
MSAVSTGIMTGVEQGTIALLGSKSTTELLRFLPHEDIILITAALSAVTMTTPPSDTILGSLSNIMHQVFLTIATNTALTAVSIQRDTPITCVNLLGVFFIGNAIQQETSTLATQYVLVAQLTNAIRTFQGEALAVAWALASFPSVIGVDADLLSLAQMTTIETFMQWLKDIIAPEGLLPIALMLLYFTAPFITWFPVLKRVYRFAIFAVTNDHNVHSIPLWIFSIGIVAAWWVDGRSESTLKTLAASAATNVGVLAIFETARFALDNDPILCLLCILVCVQILDSAQTPQKKRTKDALRTGQGA